MARVANIRQLVTLDFPSLIKSFEIELAALNRSVSTRKVYLNGIARFRSWLSINGHSDVIDRRLVQAWVADMLARGQAPATAAANLAGMRQFSKWLAAEGEIPHDPLLGVNAPKGPVPLTPCLDQDELKALVRACQGPGLRDRRDEAIVRLFAECGLRSAELLALELEDIEIKGGEGSAFVRHGKGNKQRVVVFGAKTARALDRYLRVRRNHAIGGSSAALWLGARTRQPLGHHGMRASLAERAEIAGIRNFHPHMLRHTFVGRFLEKGGHETALMSLAGWTDRAMLTRYAASTAAARAAAEARLLNLGDF